MQLLLYLQCSLEDEKQLDELSMEFPFTVATVPFRIPNSTHQPTVEYGKRHFLPLMHTQRYCRRLLLAARLWRHVRVARVPARPSV